MDEIDDEEEESPRQVAERERREAGERSARASRALMGLPEASLDRLGLEPEVREEVDRARAITSHGARRRAERHLGAVLRRFDLGAVEARLARVAREGREGSRWLHLAEGLRTRLVDGEAAAESVAATYPAADAVGLAKLVDDARRERTTGKPRGASRALFRALMAALQASDPAD